MTVAKPMVNEIKLGFSGLVTYNYLEIVIFHCYHYPSNFSGMIALSMHDFFFYSFKNH